MIDETEPASVPQELLNYARQRSVEVVSKLRKAMEKIEHDIDENDGLYPFNGGRVTQSEVCRRAGVSKVTLQGKSHKITTKLMIDDWVTRVSAGAVKGKRSVRKAVTARADAWKAAHAKIAQAYHTDRLKLVDAENRIKALEVENAALREQLSVSGQRKVTALPKKAS